MFVLGTAGHVDHGKSALIYALTGIDPDRLKEEKERGMTIDLGFAWLKLPSGREIGIVDVPGHEKLVKNMLAGVGGIDLALLVIAADEGVMPQTREHLAILDLLKIERGIAIITKKDLVDEEWLELVILEVEELLKASSLAEAPILAVSALTGEGLPDLVSAIDKLLDTTSPKKDIGRPRLPIDRVFTIAGSGTVVTGTLVDGSLSQGQEVEILPQRLTARIRGLQMHKHKIDVARPGSRVAVNLTGIATSELKRGDVITNPGWLLPTRAIDARLRLLASAPRPSPHNAMVSFHTGTSEAVGKVRLLDKEKLNPGEIAWVQFVLDRPIVVARGDGFIIRSPNETLGGGEIVDPHPRRHRRFHLGTIESLEALGKGTPEGILQAILETKGPTEMSELLAQSSFSSSQTGAAVKTLASEKRLVILESKEGRSFLFSTSHWECLKKKAIKILEDYHYQFPLRLGMPKEDFRSKLGIPHPFFASLLQQVSLDGLLIEEGRTVRLPSHQVQLTQEQEATVKAYLKSLQENPYSPPTEPGLDQELLNLLIEQGRVVQVGENVVFSALVYKEMLEKIIEYLKSHGQISVGEVRDMFQSSRKYVLPLLCHLDSQKITRRVGDLRILAR